MRLQKKIVSSPVKYQPSSHRTRSSRILLSPLGRSPIKCSSVVLVLISYRRHKRMIWVWVGKETANGQQHFVDRERRAPLVLEDIEAYPAVVIDVRMINFRHELNLWRLERIIRRECDVHEEEAVLVGRTLRPYDCSLPIEHIRLCNRSCAHIWNCFRLNFTELSLNALQSHQSLELKESQKHSV